MTASSFISPRGRAWLLLGALALAGCSRPPAAEEPLRSVKVIQVGASTYDTEPEFSAEVKARVDSRLGFRVAGKIARRQAELGQHVQAGQVLAQLDPQDFRLAAESSGAMARRYFTQGDGFLETVRAFTPDSGELSEQFDRNTSQQTSAKKLAWSYAAFITAIAARNSCDEAQ